MANPTQPRPGAFRAELENGQVVEADGSTVADPGTGSQVPAVLLRMTPARAHILAHVLDDWARVALVFATLRSSEAAERDLAWTLEASAAALGDARRCPRNSPKRRRRRNGSLRHPPGCEVAAPRWSSPRCRERSRAQQMASDAAIPASTASPAATFRYSVRSRSSRTSAATSR